MPGWFPFNSFAPSSESMRTGVEELSGTTRGKTSFHPDWNQVAKNLQRRGKLTKARQPKVDQAARHLSQDDLLTILEKKGGLCIH